MRNDPKFYFSLRSPYSWLALEDLMSHHRELAETLTWLPFWDPEATMLAALEQAGGGYCYATMSREKHLYILRDVRRAADTRGLSVSWPVDRNPWWEVPHLACVAAGRDGRMRDLAVALTRARWREGRDICDAGTVEEVATGLGLDGVTIARAAMDPSVRDAAIEILLAAYHDGVFGVPFFVRGRDRYWGVERLSNFAAGVGSRSAVPVDFTAPLPVGSDMGHAGGCG
ncbi:2-hydroxychromene-2-carboxylate isomerase [Nocardia fluminea]|uniref:2-hydroxychromene-2-carboxylate isomerase n=1 Tax=Nocardia fluminea TaxID=134984 RepID=UPI003D0D7C27